MRPHALLLPCVVLSAQDPAAVDRVLDDWHRAASVADEARYFGHMAPDAVYLGTDATERWTLEAFRAFAHPYFAKGRAWTFVPRDRKVQFLEAGRVAFFDEHLDSAHMGPCRGSGVLAWRDGRWQIVQYHLTVPIPNDLMKEVKARIAAHSAASAKPR